jgi:hypothetical protein
MSPFLLPKCVKKKALLNLDCRWFGHQGYPKCELTFVKNICSISYVGGLHEMFVLFCGDLEDAGHIISGFLNPLPEETASCNAENSLCYRE